MLLVRGLRISVDVLHLFMILMCCTSVYVTSGPNMILDFGISLPYVHRERCGRKLQNFERTFFSKNDYDLSTLKLYLLKKVNVIGRPIRQNKQNSKKKFWTFLDHTN